MKKVIEEPIEEPTPEAPKHLNGAAWKEFAIKYPESYKLFSDWLHAYKKYHAWPVLFNGRKSRPAPKYPDLPVAMQIGIFTQFVFDLAVDKLELTSPFNPYYIVDSVLAAIEESIPKSPGAEVRQINGRS